MSSDKTSENCNPEDGLSDNTSYFVKHTTATLLIIADLARLWGLIQEAWIHLNLFASPFLLDSVKLVIATSTHSAF